MRSELHVHIGRARRGKLDCISIKTIPLGKVHYVSSVFMEDVKFAVQPAGLKKARHLGVKNVHAFVRGYVVEPADPTPYNWTKVTYNPFVNDSFVDQEGNSIYSSPAVFMIGKDLYSLQS